MKRASETHSELGTLTAKIASGQSLSGAVDLGGMHIVGIVMPASWTTANLTLQASLDGNSFFNVFDEYGNETSIAAAASRFIRFDPVLAAAFNCLKLRSGTSAAAVNQAAERTLTIVGRAL